jgi:ectoine hydroxylase-related dioxygenase (phytanoyl-CoA dioxygenase family)
VNETNGGMQIAPGTHQTGEHLPVAFADAKAFMETRRLPELPQDPAAEGHKVITYDLGPGQCGLHHPMVWHGSPPNKSDEPRYAFVLRYVAAGSTWLGDSRIPYDDVGCEIGDRLTEEHFPLVETAF